MFRRITDGVGGRSTLAACIVMLAAPFATASDDEGEPLFIIRDGKRIPTAIVPPQPPAPVQRIAAQTLAPTAHAAPADDGAPEAAADAAGAESPYPLGDARYPRPRYHSPGPQPYYGGFAVDFVKQRAATPYYGLYDPICFERALEDAYWFDRHYTRRAFNEWDMNQRREKVLSAHDQALTLGLEHMVAGRYSEAVVSLTLAARLDNGDPACRVHLAQARLALGHYDEAGNSLRRALELQPNLVFVPLNLQRYYPQPAEFSAHIDRLAAAARAQAPSLDAMYLLGFMEFQRGDHAAAHRWFERVARAVPRDEAAASLRDITRPATK